jgi:cell volume regulation protein A
MSDAMSFAAAILLISAALLAAVLSNRLSGLIRIPAPALFLVAAATATTLVPALGGIPRQVDERIASVALVLILFDGGMHIGWPRFKAALGASSWVAVAGTAVTAAAIALAAHALLGFDWLPSLLLGAALSPTDPAVVFSVLGNRDVSGRSGTILEAESGLNDPVGIALLVSLLGATGAGAAAVLSGATEFALEMVVGTLVGVAGGMALRFLMRHARLPNEALHALQTVAAAGVVYGVAALLHGSGFLAVFLAGILVGEARAPFKREIERFTGALASLGEIVAFTILGLSLSWREVLRADVLLPGVVLAALTILVLRPGLVGLLLAPVRLARGERFFVLLSGLKGAVPILLGVLILEAGVPDARRLYGVIFVVVLVSVLVQAAFVPTLAARFRVPMEVRRPQPWAAGLRFPVEPGVQRHVVRAGSPADGISVAELALPESGWISMISRRGHPVPTHGSTRLEAGDEVLAFASDGEDLGPLFTSRP